MLTVFNEGNYANIIKKKHHLIVFASTQYLDYVHSCKHFKFIIIIITVPFSFAGCWILLNNDK